MSTTRHEGENELRLAAAAADEKANPARLSLAESDSDSIFDHEKKGDLVKKSSTRSTGCSGDSEPENPASGNGFERQRKWYRRLNPLKWGAIPPVPEERGPSRESNASILSIVVFQWISPLMKVSFRYLKLQISFFPDFGNAGQRYRLAIGGLSN
jgi:hypothetical protein